MENKIIVGNIKMNMKFGEIANYLDHFKNIKNKIKDLKTVKLLKTNEDKTKEYMLEAKTEDVDLRKKIFTEFAKEGITIFEMKKADATLEDAFIQIIEKGGKK